MAVREATKDNFRELIRENVVVAEFFSDNCLPCQLMAKVLEDVSLDMPFIGILTFVPGGRVPHRPLLQGRGGGAPAHRLYERTGYRSRYWGIFVFLKLKIRE